MKMFLNKFFVGALVVSLIVACGDAPAEVVIDQPFTVTDDLGREIALDGYPQQIVSTAASVTDLVFAVGAGDQLVGRDDFSVFPEEALGLPSIGSFWDGVPAEAILALEPDLVIAAEIISPDQVAEMESLGLVVYWQANPTDFAGLYDNLREIAEITGRTDTVDLVIKDLESRVDDVTSLVGQATDSVSVFYELDATDPSSPWTAGSGTFIDTIIQLAGGINVAAELQGEYAQFSSEALIVANPQVILLADAEYGVTPNSVAERAGWDSISAVVEGRVYPFDPSLLSVPGTRLVDALETLAQLLHPDLFK